MLPPAFRPPSDADALAAWLAWLDANRLTPAAARVLADAPLPASARSHLDAAYAGARAQWVLRKTALRAFLEQMREEPGQPVILIKGAALALTLYNDPAVRIMNDIDVLIAPDNLPEVLLRMRRYYQETGLSTGDDAGYLHHFIFTDSRSKIRFEIHRTLPLLTQSADLNEFLSEAQPGELEHLPFLYLKPEAQLLHLASHAILEHGGIHGALAIWFYDIDQLLRENPHIDWQKTLLLAKKLKWEAALHEALRLTRRFFQTPLSDETIAEWLDIPLESLSGYKLYRSMTSVRRNSSLTIFHILRGLSWRQRRQQIQRMLFPDATYMHQRYPNKPLLLTYPHRWLDGARKLLAGLLRK